MRPLVRINAAAVIVALAVNEREAFAWNVAVRMGQERLSRRRQPVPSLVSPLAASSKAHSKQAALRQKLEEAKRQSQSGATGEDSGIPSVSSLSDQDIRERNDRLRFEELLRKGGSVTALNDYSSDGYLNRQQEEEEIDAATAGKDRLFEGDPAPTDCFEELVSIKTENAIGANGKQRLVPWLRKSPTRHNDYLVIIADPRQQSIELRESLKSLLTDLPEDILNRMIVVNADSPAENRRWLKKSGIPDDKIELYSDEKMEWMRSYTALGEKRWSMTLFVIGNGRVRKLAREVDQYGATRTVRNAIKALDEKSM